MIKEKDKGVMQYDWFMNEDMNECLVSEAYVNSDAVLNHVTLLGELLAKANTITDFSGEVYGNVSDTLRGAFTGMNVKIYTYFQGI